jgi:2-polyprenyl-3-methyl-5-hydroxy-6-metoxy-1,4-benzoquinol methylase
MNSLGPANAVVHKGALDQREQNEIERSAAEARNSVLRPVEIDRYLSPPLDTAYPLEYAYNLLGDVRGKTVLDFGCGSGENVIPLVRRGAHVIGIDISPDLIDLAKRRAQGRGCSRSPSPLCVRYRITRSFRRCGLLHCANSPSRDPTRAAGNGQNSA